MTTGKTIALTRRICVGKVMSLLFNMLSRLVITFFPRSKHLLISWLQSPSAVILEPQKRVCHCFYCFPIYLPWSDGTGCLLFLLCNNKKPFLDQTVMCDEKWIVYDNQQQPAQWLDWEEAPKPFPKPNLHQKKVRATVWWSAADLIHSSFLNPSETITSDKYAQQIIEMHWKLQSLQQAVVNRKGLVLLHDNAWQHIAQPILQKLNELGYKVLPHLPYLNDLSPTNYHFFKHLHNFFSGKTFPQPVGCRKCFPRVSQIPKHRLLCYRNKQTYFSLAKMCWL